MNASGLMRFSSTKLIVFAVASLGLIGCRGTISKEPPIHPQQNMDFQEYFEAQEQNVFFADNRAMREPVEGTIARGKWKSDPEYYFGKNEDGSFVETIPTEVTSSFIKHGKKKYEIYCTPCHGSVGDGNGIVVNYGLVPPTSYHIDRLRNVEDGYLYDVITNGIRSMYGYGSQIPNQKDRWAIVAYIRALQTSQYARASEIPEEQLNEIKAAE